MGPDLGRILFQWEYLLYPMVFFFRMASFFFSLFLRYSLLTIYGFPSYLLDRGVSLCFLAGLNIGCCLLRCSLASFGFLFSLAGNRFMPFLRFFCCWVFIFQSGPGQVSYCTRYQPVLALNVTSGIFNQVYALYPWTAVSFLRHICSSESWYSICAQVDTMFHKGYRGWMIFWVNTWNGLAGSWIVDIFFILIYSFVGIYYFLRSIARIINFQVGFLPIPSKSLNRCVFHTPTSVTALTSEQLEAHSKSMDFSPGQDTAIIDNCANAHIWNKRDHFLTFREFRTKEQVVSTIGGKQHYPLGIGDVTVSWRDDDHALFRHTLKNVLYFSDSPVCIISSHRLACEWGDSVDEEGTYIKSKHSYSVFKWNHKKFKRTIVHPSHGLPELVINDDAPGLFTVFCDFWGTRASSLRAQYCSFNTHQNTVSSSAPFPSIPLASVMRYSKDSFTSPCTVLQSVNPMDPDSKFTIKLKCGRVLQTTQEFLHHPADPDIAAIPSTVPDFRRELENISDSDLHFLANPVDLDVDEQLWLRVHNNLNHLPRDDMYRLAKCGVIPKSLQKFRYRAPFCAACAFGKAHRRQWRYKGNRAGAIRTPQDDHPGACVSVDQLVSSQPGLLAQLSGHLTRRRVTCATIFKDHFSDFIFCHLQCSSGHEETLSAKWSFERFARDCSVTISSYRADNGRFAEQAFRDECDLQQQSISFCPVGAHHQNGIAEASIKHSTLGSRTILLHAQRLWPEAITTMLWPFALKEFIRTSNYFRLDDAGRSPYMRFTGADSLPIMSQQHPWGCPVYVLEAKLQCNPKGIPKWDPRARLGVYLGHSPLHAGSVALVLNPGTGHVSPQYHLVFDDNFTTVRHLREGNVPRNWRELVLSSSFSSTDEQYSLSDTWLNQNSLDPDDPNSAPPFSAPPRSFPSLPPVSEGAIMESSTSVSEGVDFSPPSSSTFESDQEIAPSVSFQLPVCEGDALASNSLSSDLTMPEFINLETSGLRCSSRCKKKSSKALEVDSTPEMKRLSQFNLFSHFGGSKLYHSLYSHNQRMHLVSKTSSKSFFAKSVDVFHRLNMHYDGTANIFSTFAMAALNDSNDVYTYREMLKQSDVAKFVEAMIKEITDHEERRHWICIPRSQMPRGTSTILAIWSFKRKRLPSGEILKWKARLCCHGGMQQWGINYWETYAPVVSWAAVRLLLLIASLNKIPTKSIDFVLAFPQAELEVPVYMELPAGFNPEDGESKKGCVLKVVKNLYGLKNASFHWFETLKEGLEARNFRQSDVDSCVFIRNNCVMLVYVDDCIITSPEMKVIDAFVESMQNG